MNKALQPNLNRAALSCSCIQSSALQQCSGKCGLQGTFGPGSKAQLSLTAQLRFRNAAGDHFGNSSERALRPARPVDLRPLIRGGNCSYACQPWVRCSAPWSQDCGAVARKFLTRVLSQRYCFGANGSCLSAPRHRML